MHDSMYACLYVCDWHSNKVFSQLENQSINHYRDALRKVAALKLEVNAVTSIFSGQYSMFDLSWMASDELIAMKHSEYNAAESTIDFEQFTGHNECMYACMHMYVRTYE